MADQIIGPLTISSKQCDEPNVKLTKPLIRVRTDLFSSPTPSTDQIQTPFEMVQENGDAETNQENVQDKGDFTVPIASFTYPPPQVQSLEKEFENLRIIRIVHHCKPRWYHRGIRNTHFQLPVWHLT